MYIKTYKQTNINKYVDSDKDLYEETDILESKAEGRKKKKEDD